MAFPLNSKPDWRNPPWVTILLIVVNCFVFFFPQSSDERREAAAAEMYAASPLPGIELPRFARYLKERGGKDDDKKAAWVEAALDTDHLQEAYAALEGDRAFMTALHSGTIVRADEIAYADWQAQRRRVENARGQHFTERWASNPADWQVVTLLTSVFLHGSLMHLLGNMVFLFAFGYTVELTLGPMLYLAFYLLAGAAGDGADLAFRWGEAVIGLGASGAISGLMALYAVLYGTRRIKFFYQVLFYFDYVTAPALILLPFWIVDQLWMQFHGAGSGVAYMAHVGGLLGGTLLGLGYRFVRRDQRIVVPEASPPDPFHAAFTRAEALLKAMKIDEARAAFRQLVPMRPQDPLLLARYFNLAKLVPADEDFHAAAGRIFALAGNDQPTIELVATTLDNYLERAKPRPRLSVEQMARLAQRLSAHGHTALAEKLAAALLKLAPQHADLPTILYAVARACQRKGDAALAGQWQQCLRQQFPSSAEARLEI